MCFYVVFFSQTADNSVTSLIFFSQTADNSVTSLIFFSQTADNSVTSLISHDRGGEWKLIPLTEKQCDGVSKKVNI